MADRDIEQAADAAPAGRFIDLSRVRAYRVWVRGEWLVIDPHDVQISVDNPPAGRGDATRCSCTATNIAEPACPIHDPPAGRGDLTQSDPAVKAVLDAWRLHPVINDQEYFARLAVKAAAGVLVPATAEQIAAEIAAWPNHFGEEWAWLGKPEGTGYLVAIEHASDIAREFAAGLSAGAATTGGTADGSS